MAGEGVFHGAPAGGVVGEEVGDAAGEGFGRVGEMAAADDFEQLEVSLLLAGNEVMDEHRAAGGDGLVHGGAAGLADDEVVVVEKLRHLAGPADEPDAAGIGLLDFARAGVEQPDISPEDDGEMDVGRGIQQGAAVAADEGQFGGGEIEDAEGIAGVGRLHWRRVRRNAGFTGKPVSTIFSAGMPLRIMASRVHGIGDEPAVALGRAARRR